jgi:hypothetical protein
VKRQVITVTNVTCLKNTHTHKAMVRHSKVGKQNENDGGQPSNRHLYSVGFIADHICDYVSLNLVVNSRGTLYTFI